MILHWTLLVRLHDPQGPLQPICCNTLSKFAWAGQQVRTAHHACHSTKGQHSGVSGLLQCCCKELNG